MVDTFDHRPEVAEKRRLVMRARILEATARAFTERVSAIPGIEDVAREAGISRGTFYRYFDSLDSAVVAAGVAMSDGLMTDILPVYDFLKEPWQRFSVGFRLYLVRSLLDPKRTEFLIRMDVWPHGSLVDKTCPAIWRWAATADSSRWRTSKPRRTFSKAPRPGPSRRCGAGS